MEEFEIGQIVKWQAHHKNCWGIYMDKIDDFTSLVLIREADGVPMALKTTISTNLLKK